MISELSISSKVRSLQIVSKKLLMLSTDSEHLCFWEIENKQSLCFCSHHLGMTNDAAVCSLDSVFIASPAQIHVLSVDDVCCWDTEPSPNRAIDARSCLNVHSIKERHESYPDQTAFYRTLSRKQRENAWTEWSRKKVIHQITNIQQGIAYFVENANGFTIVRRDRVSDHKWTECQPLNEGVYRWIDCSASPYPESLDAVQCHIEMDDDAEIVRIHSFQNLLIVLDEKHRFSIYTDSALFVRRLSIDFAEFNVVDPSITDFGFDGQRMWIMLNQRSICYVPFQPPMH